MKHKIKILKDPGLGRWYVHCSAGCEKYNPKWPTGPDGYFGRKTWDAAFALGLAHQKNEDIKERLKAA